MSSLGSGAGGAGGNQRPPSEDNFAPCPATHMGSCSAFCPLRPWCSPQLVSLPPPSHPSSSPSAATGTLPKLACRSFPLCDCFCPLLLCSALPEPTPPILVSSRPHLVPYRLESSLILFLLPRCYSLTPSLPFDSSFNFTFLKRPLHPLSLCGAAPALVLDVRCYLGLPCFILSC